MGRRPNGELCQFMILATCRGSLALGRMEVRREMPPEATVFRRELLLQFLFSVSPQLPPCRKPMKSDPWAGRESFLGAVANQVCLHRP
jgi:hypothetical protein